MIKYTLTSLSSKVDREYRSEFVWSTANYSATVCLLLKASSLHSVVHQRKNLFGEVLDYHMATVEIRKSTEKHANSSGTALILG